MLQNQTSSLIASAPPPVSNFSNEVGFVNTPSPVEGILAAGRTLSTALSSGSITSKQLKSAMSDAFGGSDATGAWAWKDAYEALEVAQILFVRKYGQAILSKGSDTAISMLGRILCGLPTQTRRSEEILEFQQFSTPLPLAYAASIAAGIGKGDVLLEPSAGTGLLAIFGELAGANLILNDLADKRGGILKELFPQAETSNVNAEQINDRLSDDFIPSVIIMNPPFSVAANTSKKSTSVTLRHLNSALARLAPGGRLVLITGEGFKPAGRWLEDFAHIQKRASLVFSCGLPANVFAKHGTTFDTRLSVFDKIPSDTPSLFSDLFEAEIPDLPSLIKILETDLPSRCSPEGARFHRQLPVLASGALQRQSTRPSHKVETPALKIGAEEIEFVVGNLASEGLSNPQTMPLDTSNAVCFVPWVPQAFEVKGAKSHVTTLCQSAAMASVAPPHATYKPCLFPKIVDQGILSDAQLETVVYAGQAHNTVIDGWFKVNDDQCTVSVATDEDPEAVQYRRGFFLGDGTGAGKGRQIAGIFLDNWNRGRKRGVWISASSSLLEESRRDWSALGMDETQIIPLNRFKSGADIKLPEGILFATFATLRSEGRGGSRIDQVMKWLGDDFDGVIAFDEAHSMANAVVSGTEFGKGRASLQGLAGLRLQFGLPDARVLYSSATAGSRMSQISPMANGLGFGALKRCPLIHEISLFRI